MTFLQGVTHHTISLLSVNTEVGSPMCFIWCVRTLCARVCVVCVCMSVVRACCACHGFIVPFYSIPLLIPAPVHLIFSCACS